MECGRRSRRILQEKTGKWNSGGVGGILQENVKKWSAGGVGGCSRKTRETAVRSGGIFQQNAGKECMRSGGYSRKMQENGVRAEWGGYSRKTRENGVRAGWRGCSRKMLENDGGRSGGIMQENFGKMTADGVISRKREMTAGGVGGYLGRGRKKVTADRVGGHSRNECP